MLAYLRLCNDKIHRSQVCNSRFAQNPLILSVSREKHRNVQYRFPSTSSLSWEKLITVLLAEFVEWANGPRGSAHTYTFAGGRKSERERGESEQRKAAHRRRPPRRPIPPVERRMLSTDWAMRGSTGGTAHRPATGKPANDSADWRSTSAALQHTRAERHVSFGACMCSFRCTYIDYKVTSMRLQHYV